MKKIAAAALTSLAILLSGCATVVPSPEKYSLIEDHVTDAIWEERVRVTKIDHEYFYIDRSPKNIAPGNHSIGLSVCTGSGGNCSHRDIQCNTLAGYLYTVASHGCKNMGRRMDFEGANSYWAAVDADPIKRAADMDAASKQVKEEKDAAERYNENERAKYVQAERAGLEARTKQANLLKSFRASLAEGTETNCGPVIEVKKTLVKVSYAVAEYGNEHWIRRNELFPRGYGCSFHRGEYQPPQ